MIFRWLVLVLASCIFPLESLAQPGTTATAVWGQGVSFTSGFINTSATGLSHPNGVAVDGAGNVYIADFNNNRVLYYPAGSTTATVVYGQGGDFTTRATGTSATALYNPSSLALDSGGNLYVADTANNRVLYFPAGSTTATRVYGQSGSFTTNTAGTSATSLRAPSGVALDSGGNLYIADTNNYRVLYFPAGSTTPTVVYGQSNFTNSVDATSANALSYVYAVAVDSAGNLYAADGGNNRVLYFPAGSTTATRVYGQLDFTSSSATTFNDPVGLALDSSGNLYISELLNNRVQYYPAGSTTPTVVYGQTNFNSSSHGLSATKLYFPWGLAVDSIGNLYVSDYQNDRVLEFAIGPPTSYTLTGPSSGALNTASTTFTVTPNEPYTGTITIAPSGGGLSTPIVLTFSDSETAQTFTITPAAVGPVTLTSTNSGGLSNPAVLSYSTPPAAPSILSVTPGNGQIAVAFTPNATGGSAITGYTATCGASSISGSSSPIAVTGLANGTGYTCTVTATNPVGTSPASAPSTSVAPVLTSFVAPPAATFVWGQGGSFTTNSNGTSATALNYPQGIAVDSGGDVYVADSGNNRVLYFPAGSTVATVVYGQAGFTANTSGTSATALNRPSGVVLDSGGNLYVSDDYNNRVLYFPAGSTTATVVYGQPSLTTNTPGTSATGLSNPQGLALDGSGNLYVADYANNRVLYYSAGSTTASRVYGQGGSFTANVYGTSATSLGSPAAVALDSSRNLYVADYSNNRVLYFPAGSTTATLVYGQGSFTSNSAGTSATALYEPSGLALNSSGNLYVADYANNRLLEFGTIQAVSYTLTGPPGGALNTASTNFTVTPASPLTTTISIAPSGGGLSTPIVLTFSGSSAPQTFSITPTAVGPVTLTPTNNNSLTNPGALSYSTPPAAPTITSASAGNTQISVAFTANATGGSAITSYTATCGATSVSGSTSPIAVTGLTNGTAYSCTVSAANAYGPSAASTASSATPMVTATLPSAPTIVSITPGPGSATVAFTPPASSGGLPILGYQVTCGPVSTLGPSSPVTVAGLSSGVSYSCSVAAITTLGTGPSSAPLPVIPQPAFIPATGYVFAGPLGGPVGMQSTNFTLTPNNSYTGTITVTPSGGGLSKPVTLIWGGSKVLQPFTITPTTIGPVILTPNSNGGLPDAAPLVYATPPAAPVMGGAAWSNGSISVSFTPGANGGSPITGFTAVCSATNSPLLTATGAASPLVLSAINGTPYSCAVKAANAFGASATSAASNYATPGTPYAPQSVSAAAGNGQAIVSFTAPAANGTPPTTGYTVVSNPGGVTVNAMASPATVTGLTNGVAYTFTVTAANGYGSGPGSVSNSVTPSATSQPLSLGQPLFPVGVQGAEYPMQILSAVGGAAPYFFTIDSGALPMGLVLSGQAFGGTPTAAGNVAFTLKVTDAAGNAAVAPASIAIEPFGADLILSDALVSFSATSGELPDPASVTVRSSDIEQLLAYTVSPADSWLVSPGNGTSPGSISIALSQAALGLTAGTYRSAITLTCAATSPCAGSTKTIAVVLNVAQPGLPSIALFSPVVTPLGAQFSTAVGSPLGDPFGSFPATAGTWQASVLPGANWLSLTSQAGTVNFAVDPSAVAGNPAQIYSGTIRVTQADGSQTDHSVVLDMLPPGTPAKPSLSTAGLVFAPGAGPQHVAVYAGSSYPLAYQASASAAWLSVNPAIGTALAGAPGQSVVSVNPAGLAPGVYRGNVSYALASDAVRTVNVTLVVQGSTCDATQLIATQTGLPHNFQTVVGLPVDLALTLVNGCGAPVTSAQVSASFSNGDQPVQLSPLDATSGTFVGTWIPGTVASQVAVTGAAAVQGLSPATAAIVGKVTPD